MVFDRGLNIKHPARISNSKLKALKARVNARQDFRHSSIARGDFRLEFANQVTPR